MIDRFGVQAILGRQLYALEVNRINMAEHVINAYQSRKQSDNFAEWVGSNPDKTELLAYAERLNNGQ
jgi:hypothetical protein